jgi:SAM-dependent methyltransferase
LYSKLFLFLYDQAILGPGCRFVWGCPAHHFLTLYNEHVSANHLDIGVGTGYFLDRCNFLSAAPRLALMDLNPNCLEMAGKRLARYRPEIYRRNVLEPFAIEAEAFDSVGLLNLLHCLPGNMRTKGVVFDNVKAVLNPGGVVFGSTILHGGVKRSLIATCQMYMVNRRGYMTNWEDDLEGLKRSLEEHFPESHVKAIGCEALFWARQAAWTAGGARR